MSFDPFFNSPFNLSFDPSLLPWVPSFLSSVCPFFPSAFLHSSLSLPSFFIPFFVHSFFIYLFFYSIYSFFFSFYVAFSHLLNSLKTCIYFLKFTILKFYLLQLNICGTVSIVTSQIWLVQLNMESMYKQRTMLDSSNEWVRIIYFIIYVNDSMRYWIKSININIDIQWLKIWDKLVNGCNLGHQ